MVFELVDEAHGIHGELVEGLLFHAQALLGQSQQGLLGRNDRRLYSSNADNLFVSCLHNQSIPCCLGILNPPAFDLGEWDDLVCHHLS